MLLKPDYKIFILITFIFLGACTPKLFLSRRLDPGDKLFLKAEKRFQKKSYDKAMSLYEKYLADFSDGALADAALMKTGIICAIAGNYTRSRNIYKRLIKEYPDSIFVQDARIEILAAFYKEGRYNQVIRQAPYTMRKIVSPDRIIRLELLLGDAYLASGALRDAVIIYAAAYNKSSGFEKQGALDKLKAAVSRLTIEDIQSLLSSQEDNVLNGYLMYRMGLDYVRKERLEDADKVLSAFIENFPGHEYARKARQMKEEIHIRMLPFQNVIGCLLPLTGSYEVYGNKALKGIELALNQFSSHNTSTSVKVMIKDTGSDYKQAVMAVRELSEENVAAIIGPLVTAEPAAKEAEERKIPIITLTQKDNITKTGDYVFRNFITPEMQIKSIVSYATESLGYKRFAILYPNENYGTAFMNLFWDEVIDQGGKVVGVEEYDITETDFADPIKKLVGLYYEVPEEYINTDMQSGMQQTGIQQSVIQEDMKIEDDIDPSEEDKNNNKEEDKGEPEPLIDFDAIFIPDAPKQAGLIIPQLAFYDIAEVSLFGTNLWHSDRLIEMSRQYVQGAIMADGFFAESSNKNVKDFVRIFEKTFRQKPGFIEAVAYDTAMIMFLMLDRPEIRYRSILKDRLMELENFNGITGITSFDNNGDADKSLYLLQVKGGKFFELKDSFAGVITDE